MEYAKVLLWPKENPFGGNNSNVTVCSSNLLEDTTLFVKLSRTVEDKKHNQTDLLMKFIIPSDVIIHTFDNVLIAVIITMSCRGCGH